MNPTSNDNIKYPRSHEYNILLGSQSPSSTLYHWDEDWYKTYLYNTREIDTIK